MVRSAARSVLTTTLMVLLYYLLPLDRAGGTSADVGLACGLLGFSGVLAWQISRIIRSDYPRLRAVEAAAVSLPLFVLVFAATYFILEHNEPGSFSQPLTRTDALYFTFTVFSTVGFGDIVPKTETARVTTMLQMIGDLIAVGLIIRLMLGAVTIGLRRRAQRQDDPDAAPSDGL
jgi:voltage-gated potassium channel